MLSYEEYHPYGTTAYRAADSTTEVSAKRYRYTGKEKDEETGLYDHGARYYACWLGRWTAADPSGLGDGNNRFRYVGNNPVNYTDSGGTEKKPSYLGKLAAGVAGKVVEYTTGDPDLAEKATDAVAKSVAKETAPPGRDPASSKSKPFRKDVAEFSQKVNARIDSAASAVGNFAFEATTATGGSDGLAVTRAVKAETGARVLGGTLAVGVGIAGGFAEAPDRFAAGNAALARALDPTSGHSWRTRAENYLEAQGEYANVARPVFEAFLVFAPGGAGSRIKGPTTSTPAASLESGASFGPKSVGAAQVRAAPRPARLTVTEGLATRGALLEETSTVGSRTNTVRPSDLSGGKHAADRPLADVISEASKRVQRPGHPADGTTLPQGRWSSKEATQAAANRADPALGRQVVELEPGEGVVVHGSVSSYPPRPGAPTYEIVEADRALALPQSDGTIHIFPIDSTHYLYGPAGAR